jgi:eukaryotic-like serine/threonine-protein kinase
MTGAAQSIQVSIGGGCQPRWRGDGKELFYLGSDGRMMAAEVKADASTLSTGPPRVLFQTRIRTSDEFDQYYPTRDGQRFLLAEPADQSPDAITVVLNWATGLKG